MGCSASAPGSRTHCAFGVPSLFPGYSGYLEAARRCGIDHSEVPSTEGVGVCRRALRLDGCGCITIRLRVGCCEYDGIPDRNDGCCGCVLGAAPAIPTSQRMTYRAFCRRSSAFIEFALKGLRDAEGVYEKTTSRRARDASQELHNPERSAAPQR